ncbi:MAG: hypothetical protein R6V27_12160 [Balneolaceae bacterium]
MNNDPKEKKYGDQYLGIADTQQKKKDKTGRKLQALLNSNSILIAAGSVQIVTGMSIVGITILGLLTPLWIAAVLSMLGSVSSMFGVYMIFHAVSTSGSFDTLINQSIKRVIRDQN